MRPSYTRVVPRKPLLEIVLRIPTKHASAVLLSAAVTALSLAVLILTILLLVHF